MDGDSLGGRQWQRVPCRRPAAAQGWEGKDFVWLMLSVRCWEWVCINEDGHLSCRYIWCVDGCVDTGDLINLYINALHVRSQVFFAIQQPYKAGYLPSYPSASSSPFTLTTICLQTNTHCPTAACRCIARSRRSSVQISVQGNTQNSRPTSKRHNQQGAAGMRYLA
ncbi:hypothetical protein M431DRAFT_418018 [Trichoderma harzianum CBS 226.95]|uniref:Uncharacterized protein n=1 Tax=Trichoderma harzianum CBS 226.95 TaxID=983964 RepID=A0A2T4AG99_TRIHA|nr:hypothetical protein M431DRAFT_418018 [Trichoderma harzianum CBS 226.95]PTB56120.1 hypothetical protein M431DRAFT_418018 [Trichoderma harzianum CBS 226.95]